MGEKVKIISTLTKASPPPKKKGHEKSLTKRWNSIKQKQ